VRRLRWDEWNVAHIARPAHEVTPEEVEEVLHSDYAMRETYKGRVLVIGPTQSGRMLAAVLAPEGEGAYYTVSARPASKQERRIYQLEKEMTQ